MSRGVILGSLPAVVSAELANCREYGRANCEGLRCGKIEHLRTQGESVDKEVRQFVAYHDSNRWDAYKCGRKGELARHWTRRNYREETLVGNRVWVIEGRESPEGKQYKLRSVGIISHVTPASKHFPPGRLVHFRVETNSPENDLTQLPWFKKLLKKTGRFRFGLSPIADPQIIAAFEAMGRGK
jgi:hypothetical protein